MTEIEIGRGKRGRRAYSFDDIAVVPSRRTRDPEEVSVSWQIDAYHFDIPVMAAPMDSVVSPETAITLGVADVIADVVETGATLRSQGLEVFGEPILKSEAVLVRREGSEETAAVEVLRRRLLGVITARHYVMLDYDVPATLVDRACEITPGLESPTVSHLQNRDWFAVRAMVPRAGTNAVMDELYDLGARAILVTDITACRL